jgi:hypothetical protein
MSNAVNWNTHYQNRLIKLSEIVQSGNVAEFDTFLPDFQAKYGASYDIPEGMVKFVTVPAGMSLLQLAALSGEPEMVTRVYDIVSTLSTFDINYRVPEMENEFFDKTARGIVDRVLRRKDLLPEQRKKYETIKTLLLDRGASKKRSGSVCRVIDGLLYCGALAASFVGDGGKTRRNRRKQRKSRKQRKGRKH